MADDVKPPPWHASARYAVILAAGTGLGVAGSSFTDADHAVTQHQVITLRDNVIELRGDVRSLELLVRDRTANRFTREDGAALERRIRYLEAHVGLAPTLNGRP